MASMIFMGLPEDQAVLAAIGRIAIRHGQLDYCLRDDSEKSHWSEHP
jgi:hypothetical protein